MKKGTYEYNVLQQHPVSDKMRHAAEMYSIPEHICLFTRFGACETVLVLEGVCAFHGEVPEFNYRFYPLFPYGVTGNTEETNGVVMVDFSSGPALHLGDIIPGTELEIVELDVQSNLIATKKK